MADQEVVRTDISSAIRKANVAAEEADDRTEDQHLEVADMVRIAFVALACAAVWFRVWEPYPRFSVIGPAAALIGIYPILREAFEALLARRMTMELSMTIAIAAALAIGQFFTGLVIILFVLIAEVLESRRLAVADAPLRNC